MAVVGRHVRLIFIYITQSAIICCCNIGNVQMTEYIRNFFVHFYRKLCILIRPYLVCSFVTYLIAYGLVFHSKPLNDLYFHVVLFSICFLTVLMGVRNFRYSCYICIGFLSGMTIYGIDGILLSLVGLQKSNIFTTYILETLICVLLMSVSLVVGCFLEKKTKDVADKIKRDFLYQERLGVYNAISNYLSGHTVVGINSLYGNGKSTIVEVLKNENEEWNFITISVLSTTVENVEYCIVREIDRLLCSYGIFSNFISKIKLILSQKYSFYVGELLFDDLSYEKRMKYFVNDILRLKRVVVLNFEDIDRVEDKVLLNKIFAICESLVKYEEKYKSNLIKVIYQCNMDKLNSLFNDVERYVEKFIPNYYTIDVLEDEVFETVLQKNQERYKKIKDVQFGFLRKNLKQNLLQQEVHLSLKNHSIRGIELILDKTNTAFKFDESISVNKTEDVESVLIFYITMYFLPHVYEALEKNVSMSNQKLFYSKKVNRKEKISLQELRNLLTNSESEKKKIINEYFYDENNEMKNLNEDALLFLSLLGYNDDFFDTNTNNATKYNKMLSKEKNLYKLLNFHSYFGFSKVV